MVFANSLYLNKNYKKFTVSVDKIQEVGEASTPRSEESSALDILRRAAKSYTQLPEKRYGINLVKRSNFNYVTMCDVFLYFADNCHSVCFSQAWEVSEGETVQCSIGYIERVWHWFLTSKKLVQK